MECPGEEVALWWKPLPVLGSIGTLAEAGAQELVALGAVAGESPWLIDALELAQVAGVAALIDIWVGEAKRERAGLPSPPSPSLPPLQEPQDLSVPISLTRDCPS